MIGPRELVIFIAEGSAPILIVTGLGFFFFSRWAKKEKEAGRRFKEAHLAEVMRDKPGRDD